MAVGSIATDISGKDDNEEGDMEPEVCWGDTGTDKLDTGSNEMSKSNIVIRERTKPSLAAVNCAIHWTPTRMNSEQLNAMTCPCKISGKVEKRDNDVVIQDGLLWRRRNDRTGEEPSNNV